MFRAIGVVIVLYALSQMFVSFDAFDSAMVESFKAIELAAKHSQAKIEQLE